MPSDASSSPSRHSSSEEQPQTPLGHYFSRRSSVRIKTTDLPLEQNAIGAYSPWGIFYGSVFLTAPLSYIYILLILLRELCVHFPLAIYEPIKHYLPYVAKLVSTMQQSSLFVEAWCVVEALFFILLKLHVKWLQQMDPLERSLSSAPMLTLEERKVLWKSMTEAEADDPIQFISGWFFDQPIEGISKYDIRDFIAWSMFEGRNLEHLTLEELEQLNDFVDEIEWRISLQMYGAVEEEDEDKEHESDSGEHDETGPFRAGTVPILKPKWTEQFPAGSFPILKPNVDPPSRRKDRQPRPKQMFRFDEGQSDEPPNFFSNLYENYKQRYEQYRSRINSADFHPVQDLRNFMAETRQTIVEAEESAVATATHMAGNAYSTVVAPGSNVDKKLHELSHATSVQLTEAWNSVKEMTEGMTERLETANILSSQRKRIRQQLKGYRLLLHRMIIQSSTIPSKQMAGLMRKITECNEAIERLEHSARDAFGKATGYAQKSILHRKEPQRYAKYSSDPLLGIASYPLAFHLLILGATEIPLRIMLGNRGFSRLKLGPVNYYFHPGSATSSTDLDDETGKTPLVFVHGIGIGLITYKSLIDCLLKSGRPIFLPEIPYVSGFRPWQSPNAVLSPAVVTSTMTAILATHGYLRGAFVGHSYGTSWLSYMIKYSPNAIAAALFLDPICFCLHVPRLTKQFVYHRPDPGSISYMVRTDVTVNWTIQRSFPWARIVLFTEDIQVPCAVFVSDRDQLVPAGKIENYLKSKGAPVRDFEKTDMDFFSEGDINVTVFRGDGHGDWTERPCTSPKIAECAEVLCSRAEARFSDGSAQTTAK